MASVRGVEGRWASLREVVGSVRLVFISFRFLCIEAAAGDHAIEVHRCCCPGGLLGGPCAGRGGLGGISKGGCGLGLSLYDFLPLPLCRGCRRRSSDRGPLLLLSGWTPRWHRCGAWRPLVGPWLETPEWPWCVVARHVCPFVCHVLGMLRVLPSWDARGVRHKSFT